MEVEFTGVLTKTMTCVIKKKKKKHAECRQCEHQQQSSEMAARSHQLLAVQEVSRVEWVQESCFDNGVFVESLLFNYQVRGEQLQLALFHPSSQQ